MAKQNSSLGSKLSTALSGAASTFGSAYSTYNDVQSPKAMIASVNNMQLGPNAGGSSFDSWTQAYLSNRPIDQVSLSDMGYNKGKGIFNTISSSLQGAGAGASIGGGWGALAGGVVGTLGGLFGMSKAKDKATQGKEAVNTAINYTNDFNQRSLMNNLANIQNNQYNNLASSFIAANGGPLNMRGKGVMSPFGARFDLGGPLHSYGTDWGFGLKYINSGDSHENNPYDGVQMGVDPQGTPNLVEEGEVVWNNYVFSNRMRVPKAVREKYKLRGRKDLTFADAVKKVQKESEERPNDPIAQRGLEDILIKLAIEQENQREQMNKKNTYSQGGGINIKPSKRGTFTAAATKHNKSIQEFASQVLANPEDYSPAMRKKANFARNASKWHAHGGPMGNMYDGFGLRANELLGADRGIGTIFDRIPRINTSAIRLPHPLASLKDQENNSSDSSWLANLRYVPAVGAGINVFSDLMGWTNKPDYSNADAVLNASKGIRDVSFTPIGDYMRYTPFDRMFYINQLNANSGATRRNLLNTSGGNRGAAMAGLLAANYNAQNQLGQLARQAEEYNLGQRQRVAEFNRGTNQYNSEGSLRAQQANQGAAEVKMRAAAQAAQLRDAVDARIGAARSANLTNLFQSIGDIGWEEYNRNMANSSNRYNINRRGVLKYSPYYKKGGYLTIKTRRNG